MTSVQFEWGDNFRVKPNELLYLLIEGTKIEDSYLTFMRNCILGGDNFRAFRVDLGGQNSKGDNFQLYRKFAHLANDKNWAQLREYKLLSKSKNVSNKNWCYIIQFSERLRWFLNQIELKSKFSKLHVNSIKKIFPLSMWWIRVKFGNFTTPMHWH